MRVECHPELLSWNKRLEVIGYKAEGFQRNGFKHGIYESDSVLISIVKEEYLSIVKRRNNTLWPGFKAARKIINVMNGSPSLSEELYGSINQLYRKFDERLAYAEQQSSLNG
jgi:hypothetical protein